jgi:negative regulator of sigma E activity
MKVVQALQIQAYLDGELSPAEERQVTDWLDRDPEAQSLLAELRLIRTTLKENEPKVTLPEAREFFWSKVERAIQQPTPAEDEAAASDLWTSLFWRYLAPLAGVALVVLLGITAFQSGSQEDPASYLVQVENLSEEITTHTFRSESDKLVLVWIHHPQDVMDSPAMEPDDSELMFQ